MSLGDRLRAARLERGWSQLKLGQKIGLTKQAICNYENGWSHPDAETLGKLADELGVSTDYLLGRTEARGPIHTAATSRSDGYDKELPPAALKSIEEFKEFIRRKYGPKKDPETGK